MPSALLSPSSKKIKKNTPKKFLIFQGMELSGSWIKKFVMFQEMKLCSSKRFFIFSQKKAFLIFQETETPKKFFIFLETELSYISGSNLPSWKSKKKPLLKSFLYFGKWKSKNFFYFRKELTKPQKQTKNLLRRNLWPLVTFL